LDRSSGWQPPNGLEESILSEVSRN